MYANLPETSVDQWMWREEENPPFIITHLVTLRRLKLMPGSRIQAAVREYLLQKLS